MMPFHIRIASLGLLIYELCAMSFLLPICSSLNIADTNPLSEIFFSQDMTLIIVPFEMQKFIILM